MEPSDGSHASFLPGVRIIFPLIVTCEKADGNINKLIMKTIKYFFFKIILFSSAINSNVMWKRELYQEIVSGKNGNVSAL